MFPTARSLPRLTDEQAVSLAKRFFDDHLRELDREIVITDKEWRDELDVEIDYLRDPNDPNTQVWTQYAAARILIYHGIAAEYHKGAGLLFLNLIGRAKLQLALIRRARCDGDYSDRKAEERFAKARASIPADPFAK
jgi:hypothetical protein